MYMQWGSNELLSLPTRYRGLKMRIFNEQAEVVYNNSGRTATKLTSLIIVQQTKYTVEELAIKNIKLEIKTEKENTHKNVI